MSLATIRSGLASACSSVSATVYSYVPGWPVPPAVIVRWPEQWTYDTTLSHTPDYTIPVAVAVSLADPASADDQLESLIDAVVAAIRAAPTLSGASETLAVSEVTSVAAVTEGDVALLTATINVKVWGKPE